MKILFFTLAFLSAPFAGHARCIENTGVANYLREHPRWTPVDVGDLGRDDRNLWAQNHLGRCPGIAAVDFGDGGRSYVLALISTDAGGRQEKLVGLKTKGSQYTEQTLSPAQKAGQLSVIWRAGPGSSHDYATGRSVFVAPDSVIYEVMESSALQFYWSDGAFHTLQTAD